MRPRTARMDTLRRVETPEGVQLALRLAGPAPRVIAFAIDQMIRMMVLSFLSVPLAFFGDTGVGLIMLLAFAMEWFYPVLFEVLWDGATPGKKALGLQVLRDDGTHVTWSSSILRNLLRFADFLPFGYQAGLLTMSMTHDFQRLGDLAAGTVVVYRERALRRTALPQGKAERVPMALDLEEQRALLDFAERIGTWGPERSEELAGIVPQLAGPNPTRGVQRLLSMARWLTGQR